MAYWSNAGRNASPGFTVKNVASHQRVAIDYSHPITRDLVASYTGDFRRNLVDGVEASLPGVSYAGTGRGVGAQISDNIASRIDSNQAHFTGSQNRTVVMYAQLKSTYPTGIENTLYSTGGTGSGERWDFKYNSTGNLRIEIEGGGYSSSFSLSAGLHFLACKLDGSTLAGHTLYQDASKEAATGANSVATGSTYSSRFMTSILAEASSSTDREVYDSPLLVAHVWARALTDLEIAQVRQNLYLFYKPEIGQQFFTSPAVGPTFPFPSWLPPLTTIRVKTGKNQ